MESKLDEVFWELTCKDAIWPHLPVIMVETTTWKIVHCNVPAAGVFGYTPAELLGKDVEVLAPPDRREEHRQRRSSVKDIPLNRASRGTGWTKDGREVPVSVGMVVMATARGQVAVIVVFDLSGV